MPCGNRRCLPRTLGPATQKRSWTFLFWNPVIELGLGFAPSQWETSLQSNAVSHWMGANLESALVLHLCSPWVFHNTLRDLQMKFLMCNILCLWKQQSMSLYRVACDRNKTTHTYEMQSRFFSKLAVKNFAPWHVFHYMYVESKETSHCYDSVCYTFNTIPAKT